MRILGIDPGIGRLGVAVIENGSKPQLLFSDCIETSKELPQAERLSEAKRKLLHILREYGPTSAAIEKLFFSKNKKTALGVAEARGMILETLATEHISTRELGPAEIKIAITGVGNATKEDMARMIPRLITLEPKKRLDDELDAIACALAAAAIRPY